MGFLTHLYSLVTVLYQAQSGWVSRLANKKTVTIQPGGKDQSVLLATTKTKKQGKPASLLHKSVMKQEFCCMAKAVKNQASEMDLGQSDCYFISRVADNYYRPDLKDAALARLSAVHRSLKVAKSGVKKRNRQAVRIHGRKYLACLWARELTLWSLVSADQVEVQGMDSETNLI
ncbi:unnamed protein product [Thlaspi arvense]|uniref:Ribosomal eL28/Mak16 domain-containing protein n=1 Tax=Thlaspi arvense TaxID=13288 RepID=A0AAU9SXV5_THLAR|nr:unnamed protein product [Thlaspi arvense]